MEENEREGKFETPIGITTLFTHRTFNYITKNPKTINSMNVTILVRDSVYRTDPLCAHYVSSWTKDASHTKVGLGSKGLKKIEISIRWPRFPSKKQVHGKKQYFPCFYNESF